MKELGERMRRTARDPRVRGVVLHIRELSLAPAQIQTIRGLVGDVRAGGKRVIAWATHYDNAGYYVASAADEILLQPGGVVGVLGARQAFVFVRDALRRIGVETDWIQISPYKSAADMFARQEMSDEVKQMANWLLDSAFDQVVGDIASGRRIDNASARSIVDASPYTDLTAIDARVADGLVSEEDLPARLGANGKPVRILPWEKAKGKLRPNQPTPPGKHVALIRIEGSIVDGKSAKPPLPGNIPLIGERAGDITVVQEARKIASSKRAAACVLWVDSGGGSATSSEAMSSALDKVASRKPLVASMGAVAGSGGYYVTTPAHWVVAQPSTITGSIGVLTGKFVTDGMFSKLLFNRQLVTRGQRATMEHGSRHYTDDERKVVWDTISRIYDVFLDRVSSARKKSRDDIDRIGGGRVWMGAQALEHGLIDQLGSLDDAIAKAKELAGLHPRSKVREVKVRKGVRAPDPKLAAAAMIDYAIDSVRMLDGRALLLCPFIISD
jgi:protease-4